MIKKGFFNKGFTSETSRQNPYAPQEQKSIPLNQPTQQEINEQRISDSIGRSINQLTNIESVFSLYQIKSNPTSTIYKIDEFSQKLPRRLTEEEKRETIIGIAQAAEIDIDTLVKDANVRIESLESFLKSYKNKTKNHFTDTDNEIVKLTNRIEELKKSMSHMKNLMIEQEKLVSDEIVKIKSIKNFIRPSENNMATNSNIINDNSDVEIDIKIPDSSNSSEE